MKKTIIFILVCCSMPLLAEQVKLPDFPNGERNLGVEQDIRVMHRMPAPINYETEMSAPVAEVSQSGEAPILWSNHSRRASGNNQVGYLNPKGTLFLGIDEAGKGTWMTKGGIVGAWSDSIHHWTFEQTVTGQFDSILYTNKSLKLLASEFEDTKFFYKDKNNNWCDSIVASGGYDESFAMDIYGDNTDYPWPSDMPLQTVHRKDTTEQFMLLSKSGKPSVNEAGFIVGGLPSSHTADGLWPLTNAVNISREGISVALIATEDEDKYTHYIFGTDSLNIDTTTDEHGTHYTRVAPVKIVTEYDKPQAPLYIKSITMALGAKGSSKISSKVKVNELQATIFDKDGGIIATSTATASNLSKMDYSSISTGRMLTFNFKHVSDYGEPMQEGFLVSEAFRLEISGISKNDLFGIYSAKSTVHASKSYIEYEDGTQAGQNYDPYIMLNGIYNTLENYVLTESKSKFVDAENSGDTIPINMVPANSPNYKYRGYYAAKDLKEGNVFEYYSTFMPYDSVSRYWLMDVHKPDYIELGCDYDTNLGTEEDPITMWSYARLFDLYIYATSTPRIGDIITVGKCGRETVFRIREIDGATAIGEVKESMHQSHVQKLMNRNGEIHILRANKQYNILGQPIK